MSNKKFHISRHCRERQRDGADPAPRPLADFRDRKAYVLLGEQGSGKTESFKYQSREPGTVYIRTRELINGLQDISDNQTLYIDGLDEVRSGSTDGRIPLDAIRKALKKLGNPSFRVSCREADWLGQSDQNDLAQVSPDGEIIVLSLEPLTPAEIKLILEHHYPNLNLDDFLNDMEQAGLGSLLGNPHLLKLLAKAHQSNERPTTRLQAFELACRAIVLESNEEHQHELVLKKHGTDNILESAGEISAKLLLSDVEGFCLNLTDIAPSFPAITDISWENLELARYTLRTRLFQKGTFDSQRQPIHRTIAEFLGARHLSQLIDKQGLPLGRILALMTSSDQVISSLRGLYAWLAVLGKSHTESLLTRDPLATILYGDPGLLTQQQKKLLIEGLRKEANHNPNFRNDHWASYPFGALATPDMMGTFNDILSSTSRSNEHQALADCIIDALESGVPLAELDDTLFSIVEDESWYSGIRRTALLILIKNAKVNGANLEQFVNLAKRIKNNAMPDTDGDLLGTCLKQLYPDLIKPEQVFEYLKVDVEGNYMGAYGYFWAYDLLNKSGEKEIPVLLDELSSRHDLRKQMENSYDYQRFVSQLLETGITVFGKYIPIERLYKWLNVGVNRYHSSLDKIDIKKIGDWLVDHSDIYKSLFLEGASHCCNLDDDKFDTCMFQLQSYLYDCAKPKHYTQWLLQQTKTTKHHQLAQYCFTQAVLLFYSGNNPDMTLDQFVEWLNDHEKFKPRYEELSFAPVDSKRFERSEKIQQRTRENKKQISDWKNHLHENLEQIKQGTANPKVLEDLGRAYFGHLYESKGDSPKERLNNLFRDLPELISATLEGLPRTLNRKDLPSAKEVLELHKENRRFYVEFGVLAGMDHLFQTAPEKILLLTDEQLKSAITFHLVHSGHHGDWINFVISHRPDQTSQAFLDYVTHMLRTRQHHIYGSYACAFIDEWKPIAERTSLQILKRFPVRSRSEQSSDLDYFLKAALRYSRTNELQQLIGHKLNLKSLDMRQRGKWLAAGLVVTPTQYQNALCEYMETSSQRMLVISSFFSERRDQWRPDFDMQTGTIAMLIQHMGLQFAPYSLSSGFVTPEMDATDLIRSLISSLAQSYSPLALSELNTLIDNPDLSKWQYALKNSRQTLEKRLADLEFSKPSLQEVVNTLSNLAPANPTDMRFLVQDIFDEHAQRVRNDSDNKHRHFWNHPEKPDTASPKIENDCRDILLSQIDADFERVSIYLDKEKYYVEDKRSDLAAIFNQWNIPIEIKKSDYYKNAHDNIWTSWSNQLIEHYSRDPGAYGNGIYLVFWFGSKYSRKYRPSKKKPGSAEELKSMLLDLMSDDEKKKIGVCVIDCSLKE